MKKLFVGDCPPKFCQRKNFERLKLGLSSFGQSTVELALILPILCFFLFLVIYAFRANHTLSEQSITTYGNRLALFNHGNGMAFDPLNQIDVPAGQYSEHIPPSGAIDLGDIAKTAAGFIANLGLGELFSKVSIFDNSTYYGAFAQGFTYSIANSTTQNFINGGTWNDLNAKDLEHASWAGAANALSSYNHDPSKGNTANATNFFQGDDPSKGSWAEFFGSGAQAGLVGFAQSEGNWKAGVASAAGGMLNSDQTKGFVQEGKDFSEIMKGAGIGAVQSSISGALNGNLDIKNVLYSSAAGAVNTEAFAKIIPLSGNDPKNSATYGAFNGALSSVLSGGNLKTTLVAAGAGALGSQQIARTLGGSNSLGYRASVMGYQVGGAFATGQSAQAIGAGAITGMVSNGVGWAGNQISSAVSENFEQVQIVGQATARLNDKNIAHDVAKENIVDPMLDATSDAFLNGIYVNSELTAPITGGPTT